MPFYYIHWNTDPVIINLFGLPLRYYGILFIGGLLLSGYVLSRIFKKEGIPPENLEKLSTYCLIGILFGARLGHCLFYEPSYYLSHPLEMLLPISFPPEGGIEFTGYRGLASHGGVLGLLIAIWLYARNTKQSVINTIDLIAVVTGISLGAIRLGNFMNSEIIGMPTTVPWAVVFERIDDIPRHPAQLYEAFSYFLVCGILMLLYYKMRPKLKNGVIFGLGLILFFIARFLIEFVKENQVGFEDGMIFNMGQLLSLPYIAVGVGFLIYGLKSNKKSGS